MESETAREKALCRLFLVQGAAPQSEPFEFIPLRVHFAITTIHDSLFRKQLNIQITHVLFFTAAYEQFILSAAQQIPGCFREKHIGDLNFRD